MQTNVTRFSSSGRARGVYAAALTPFTADLSPDTEKFVEHCRWLLASGCDGLALFGTTGEGVSLSADQKCLLIEAAHGSGLPMDRLIAGTGACAMKDAITVARAAVRSGCEGVLCLPPFYYKNPNEDGLFGFFDHLIESVGDARLKLYLYHFPDMSAVPITASLLERLITAHSDTVAGLKDSSGDWSYTRLLLESFPGFGVFSGSEQFLLDNLKLGGAGCISATTNLTASQAQSVFTAWRNSKEDNSRAQDKLSEVRLALQGFPMVPMLKTAKAHQFKDPACLNMLPPLVGLSRTLEERLVPLLSENQLMKTA